MKACQKLILSRDDTLEASFDKCVHELNPAFGVPIGVVGVPGLYLVGGMPSAEGTNLHLPGDRSHQIQPGMTALAGHLSGQRTTQGETGTGRCMPQRGFKQVATGRVEEHGDTVRGKRFEPLVKAIIVAVNGGVEAEFINKMACFCGTASDADDASGAKRLGDLSSHRADTTGGTADKDDIARSDGGDVDHAVVGGHTLIEQVFGTGENIVRYRCHFTWCENTLLTPACHVLYECAFRQLIDA